MAHSQAIALPWMAGIFDVPKKVTVIRLRWLLVIICSYLLLSSPGSWLPPSYVQAFIVFYILTTVALYFVHASLFDSSRFYSPLVIFDTLFVTAALVISGGVETDFYLTYFVIVILCTIWQDFRGLVVIGILATLLYGYLLLKSGEIHDPSIYLRVPFLFAISLFYGYFVQIVRVQKALKERAEQEARDMAMIQTLSQALPASLDYTQVLDTVRDKINNVIHPSQLDLFMLDDARDSSHGILFTEEKGSHANPREVDLHLYPIVQECILKKSPVIQQKVSSNFFPSDDGRAEKEVSFPMSTAVPIAFRGELHGVMLLNFDRGDRIFSPREIQFCQIVAFSTAIALSNAKKYEGLQAEASRRQVIAEQLAEANRLKSEFLANTTHELRTPIAVIIGFGSLMIDEVIGPLTQRQRATVTGLIENAQGLLGLVDQVLDYSKLEKGDASLFVRPQEVRAFIDDLSDKVSRLEESKPYKVRYEIDVGVLPLRTDWEKLKRVLFNLLSNAIKFTDRGGVRLSVRMGLQDEIAFIVSDTGIGIPRDQIPLIFDKFRQLDGSASRRYGGTGLGLTVTKNLVDLLGGRLEVESEMGKGSTFTVTIPINAQQEGLDPNLGDLPPVPVNGAAEMRVAAGCRTPLGTPR